MNRDTVSMDFDFVNMWNYTVDAGFGLAISDFGSGDTDLYTILLYGNIFGKDTDVNRIKQSLVGGFSGGTEENDELGSMADCTV
jgi:hypothetical protein